MKNISIDRAKPLFRLLNALKLGVMLVAIAISTIASAQDSVIRQGVLLQPQTGTIQLLRQDDGFLTISGRDYGFDNEVSLVFLNAEEIGSEVLDEGMVVRYTLDRDGMLVRIEILGPIGKIRELEEEQLTSGLN